MQLRTVSVLNISPISQVDSGTQHWMFGLSCSHQAAFHQKHTLTQFVRTLFVHFPSEDGNCTSHWVDVRVLGKFKEIKVCPNYLNKTRDVEKTEHHHVCNTTLKIASCLRSAIEVSKNSGADPRETISENSTEGNGGL